MKKLLVCLALAAAAFTGLAPAAMAQDAASAPVAATMQQQDRMSLRSIDIGGQMIGGGLQTIESSYGHDGFLIEKDVVGPMIRNTYVAVQGLP